MYNYLVMTSEIASQLESILDTQEIIPRDRVNNGWQDRVKKIIYNSCLPDYFLTPPELKYLSNTVRIASKNRCSILPCGSGTKLSWGGVVSDANLVISTQKLNRVIDHAVSDLTITVEAGIKLRDLQTILGHHNQFLPIDPAYPDNATIGGILATADTGSWRQRYGGIRDLVLGLSFTGSYGTLGIISTVTFRLYPIPEASGTLLMTGEAENISQMAQTFLQSGLQPTAAEMISPSVVKTLELGENMGLMVRFQSIPESVNEQSQQVQAIAEKLSIKVIFCKDEIENNLWKQLQKLIRVDNTNVTIKGKIGIIPNQAVNWLIKLNELTQQQGWGMINLSSGIGQFKLDIEPSLGILKQLRSLAQENRGFLTILEADQSIKKQFEPWGYSGNALPLMKQIKTQFDPHNLFSPSRFI